MNESLRLIELLEKKTKLVAMLAPSFPIVYEYPQIVLRLRALGFSYVVEVAAGAKRTNDAVYSLLKNNPQKRYVTSPCASFVRLIRKKYPHLVKYLASQADSPMVATAKIVRKKYPFYQPVFIGPCIVKKLEASEDYPELNILVITYKELRKVFRHFNIPENIENQADNFDIAEQTTRIYPIDGGLTETSSIRNLLKDEEIRIVSGWKNCDAALAEFENNPTIRLLDILFCDGGCINGPGIASSLTIEERVDKIRDFKTELL